jgi:RNA polymerase sigma-70 factor (ECF subfamily)
VILLREVEGLSYDEIAKTLKVRKGTVMSRLHYARQRLQETLTPYIEEGEIREKK